MDWNIILLFGLYAGIGILTLLVWWLIYDGFLSQGHSLKETIFGKYPNPAVSLDLMGGFLSVAILLYTTVSTAPRTGFRFNIPAVILSVLAAVVLLALLRGLMAVVLRAWFRDHRDAQGDVITLNNELFKQRNIATGIFTTVLYLILVAGLSQLDPWNPIGDNFAWLYNLIGIWVMGLLIITVHSFAFLGYGPYNNILHECFHDNNPSAPLSLLGMVAGMLPLVHNLLVAAGPGKHLFNTWDLWGTMGIVVLMVLVARGVLQLIMFVMSHINLRWELVIHDNVAWGILDGALIFSLMLIMNALLG